MKMLWIALLVSSCCSVFAGGEAADPFDQNRNWLYNAPASPARTVGKRIHRGGDVTRLSRSIRESVVKIAEENHLQVVSTKMREHKPFGSEHPELFQVRNNFQLKGDLRNVIGFFEALDAHPNSMLIERMDMSVSAGGVELPNEREIVRRGSILSVSVTLATLVQRGGGDDAPWPDDAKFHGMTGLVPNLLYQVGRALQGDAYVTSLKVRRDRVTVQGRSADADSTRGMLLENVDFLVGVNAVKPNTVGKNLDARLWASEGRVAPEI